MPRNETRTETWHCGRCRMSFRVVEKHRGRMTVTRCATPNCSVRFAHGKPHDQKPAAIAIERADIPRRQAS